MCQDAQKGSEPSPRAPSTSSEGKVLGARSPRDPIVAPPKTTSHRAVLTPIFHVPIPCDDSAWCFPRDKSRVTLPAPRERDCSDWPWRPGMVRELALITSVDAACSTGVYIGIWWNTQGKGKRPKVESAGKNGPNTDLSSHVSRPGSSSKYSYVHMNVCCFLFHANCK